MPEERKIVTVLFADLVDSTQRAGRLDPEVIRGALGRTFAAVREVLTSHGGTVEKFIGDAVMAVFGVPTAHDDDAERAVRAAFALHELIARGEIGRPLKLDLRIGVNTGEVVAGTAGGGDFLVTGQPVVVGARLEQAAHTGEILVGPLTRRLTEGAVSYGRRRPIDAKGIGRLEASPAKGLVSSRPVAERSGSLRSPLVDRERELRFLHDALEGVLARRRPYLVTSFGAAGVGKSRLITEFARIAAVPTVLRGRCLPYGDGITYWPLHEILRERVAQGDVEALALSAAMAGDAPEPELSPAFRRFVEHTLAGKAGLVVFEDVHWAEAPLLDLIENVTSRIRAPVLFVCLSRPELLDRRPNWGGGRTDAAAIMLDPLPPAETDALVRGLLAGTEPPSALREAVVERTEGNPLYVEEFLRMLIDARVIRGGEGRWDLPPAITLSVPPTLQGIIEARLDHLPAALKRLLQRASVVGRTFWSDALVALGADEARLDAELGEVVARDFVEDTAERGPHGASGFRFRHVLVRDVAYAELAKAERIALHDACGRWLERTATGQSGEYRDLVTYHAGQAFELAQEIGDARMRELGGRALALLLAAGGRARRRADHQTSRLLYERAVAVAASAGAEPSQRAEAEGYAALAQHRLELTRDALARVDRAIAGARAAEARAVLVTLLTWRAHFTLDESVEGARPLFEEAVRVGRELDDADAEVHALLWSTEPLKAIGDLGAEQRVLEDTHARAMATGARGPLVSCLVALTDNALQRGDLDTARSRLGEVTHAAAASESKLDHYKAIDAEARVALAAGDVQRATEVARQALDFVLEHGTPGAVAHACETVGDALLVGGDGATARAALEKGLAALGTASPRTSRAPLEWRLARAHLALGELTAAAAAATAAVDDVARTDVLGYAQARATLAAVHVAAERVTAAQELRTAAVEALSRTGYRAALRAIKAEIAGP